MINVQKKVKTFIERYEMEIPVQYRLIDLVSELGEFSKELLKSSDYGKKSIEFNEKLKDELGDTLFSLLCILNTYQLNIEDLIDFSINKYQERILKKGNPGS